MVDSGGCCEYCQSKLHLMRQIRLALRKSRDRVERPWLIPDGVRPAPAVESQSGNEPVEWATRTGPYGFCQDRVSGRDHIHVVDPFSNLMTRFARDADPQRMKKDVTNLVKASGGWLQKDN